MAKTAAQLVPLKTQLSTSMSIFRFADATTDFAGSVAYQSFPYDNAGVLGTPNGTNGVAAYSGTPVPSTPLTTPNPPVLSTNQNAGYQISSGLNRYQTQTYYHVVFFDSSYRESQSMIVFSQIPGATSTGSVTFAFTWPANVAGALIYKAYSSYGPTAIVIPNTVSSYVDTSAAGSYFNAPAGTQVWAPTSYGPSLYPVSRYCYPSPNSGSLAPPVSAANCAVTYSATGGALRSAGYGYGLTAFNTLGETLISTETDVVITGTPWIAGSTMTAVTLASGTASGTLPAGKYYYQVTAYTQNAAGVNGINTGGFTNSNSYGNFGSGAGWTESIPCAEVFATTTATGNITLSWTPVTNAAGYVIYRSQDVPAPVQAAPTTATTGGTLAAGTYYYKITATNANGESLASNERSIVTTGTTSTVALSWANAPGAYGYNVYRGTAPGAENVLLTTITSGATLSYTDTGTAGTAATGLGWQAATPISSATGVGQETYLTGVSGGTTPSFQDNGSLSTAQNSGFKPPAQYNAIYSAVSVAASWSAVPGATGYNLYRNVIATVGNQTNMAYFNVTSGLSLTDTGNQTGSKYTPQYNWSGSANITTVGRYIQVPNNNAAGSYTIDRLGFTVSLVAGQQYRFAIYDQSNQVQIYTGPYFTAPSSATQYYECNPAYVNASYAGQYFYFYLEGVTYSSTISWGPNPKGGLVDNPTYNILSENNTWVGHFSVNNDGTMNSGNQLATAARDGNVPTQVLSETLSSVPMRVSFRMPYNGTSINGIKGTMLGGSRLAQYAYSNNQTYTTPIKSIVPNWQVTVPGTPLSQPLFSNRWATVEVSTDNGGTFTILTNQQRYVFPTPTTQLMYRYTLPQASAAMSFDRRIMTGMPATDNTGYTFYNGYFTTDTNHTGYYYEPQGQPNDLYVYSNGNVRFGNSYGNFQYNFLSVQTLSADVDMNMNCTFNGTGQNIGLRFRNNGSNSSYGGYYAYLNDAGGWGIYRTGYSNTVDATLASGSAATNGALNITHNIRVIAVGAHLQFFIDGNRVADVQDTTGGSWYTGMNVGISGGYGIAQSWQCTALSSPNNTPPWELEYVTAYLEQ